MQGITELSFSFDPPAALIFKLVSNLLLYGWVVSTAGKFTITSRAEQAYTVHVLGHNRCYRLWSLMIALHAKCKCMTQQSQYLRHSKFQDHATCTLDSLCSLWLLHVVYPHFLTEIDFNINAWILPKYYACMYIFLVLIFFQCGMPTLHGWCLSI